MIVIIYRWENTMRTAAWHLGGLPETYQDFLTDLELDPQTTPPNALTAYLALKKAPPSGCLETLDVDPIHAFWECEH